MCAPPRLTGSYLLFAVLPLVDGAFCFCCMDAFFPLATAKTTMTAASTAPGVNGSERSSQAARIERNGCKYWVWLTRATPPSASPWYQAKKPRNMLTTLM